MAEQGISTLAQVVEALLRADPPEPRDAPVAALLLTYAKAIDDGADVAKTGPAMLAAMDALLMTPRARAMAQRGMKSGPASTAGRLDELRLRRDSKRAAG